MQNKTAVLLVNLGTPDSYKPKDVYKYLIEFLTDGRVIDKPWVYRQLLVRGLIVPFRYKQSAKSYKEIWLENGSPLMVHTKNAQKLLQDSLGDQYIVELAMRYQNPSILRAMESIKVNQVKHLIVIPLFPQYASATTGSIHSQVLRIISTFEVIPKLTLINNFATNPLFIETISDIASSYQLNSYDHFLFSFHGLPKSHLVKANESCFQTKNCCQATCGKNHNCYSAQCHATAFAIANKLKLESSKYTICFQSKLGKDPWAEPSTVDCINKQRLKGAKKLLVFCPSFVSDCLETIHEIGIEYAEEFVAEGGEALDYVRSLNDHPKWIEALKNIVVSS